MNVFFFFEGEYVFVRCVLKIYFKGLISLTSSKSEVLAKYT